MIGEFAIRRASPEDEDFLWRLYASTRAEELAAWGWPPEEQDRFLRMQYRAQRASYGATAPNAAESVLLIDGVAVGAMRVSRTASEIRLIDVALLAEHQNRGIGTAVLTGLIRDAVAAQVPVRLSVLRGNRAIVLYQRRGFSIKAEDAMYIEMEYGIPSVPTSE